MSAVSKLLLCRPDHYDVRYKINPWMDLSRTPTPERAVAQWKNLFDTLKAVGVQIELVAQTPHQPDMVFTANAGLVRGNDFVLAKFRHKERQGEEAGFQSWFEQRGFNVHVPKLGSFEGEGDALFATPDLLFTGYGFRTDRAAADEVATILGIAKMVPCELTDPRFYHLDTCFAPLSGGKALFFPDAFSAESVKAMQSSIEGIPVPVEDAVKFACNAIVLDKDVVIPAGCAETERILHSLGFRTHSVELDEYLKAGGAAKCLSLILG